MKKLLTLLALGLTLSFGTAHAADASADCAAKAAEKKLAGAAKASFEKKCVADEKAGAKAGATASAPLAAATPDKKVTQQEKMKACNKDAGEKKLKGDERKKFMSDCLKA